MGVGIAARIKENVMVLPTTGGVSNFLKGKEGFVYSETSKNSTGTEHYLWIEVWNDGMGGSGTDRYYVPAFAVKLI